MIMASTDESPVRSFVRFVDFSCEKAEREIAVESIHATRDEVRCWVRKYMIPVRPSSDEIANGRYRLMTFCRAQAAREVLRAHGLPASTPAEKLHSLFGKREWRAMVRRRTHEILRHEHGIIPMEKSPPTT